MIPQELELVDERDTESLALTLAAGLKGGQSIGLVGELGAGKTTLVRYLVKALGISAAVSSPSYVLSHEYAQAGAPFLVEHWDLYRLGALPEELMEPPADSFVRVIEWSDKFDELMAELDVIVNINLREEQGVFRRMVNVLTRP